MLQVICLHFIFVRALGLCLSIRLCFWFVCCLKETVSNKTTSTWSELSCTSCILDVSLCDWKNPRILHNVHELSKYQSAATTNILYPLTLYMVIHPGYGLNMNLFAIIAYILVSYKCVSIGSYVKRAESEFNNYEINSNLFHSSYTKINAVCSCVVIHAQTCVSKCTRSSNEIERV